MVPLATVSSVTQFVPGGELAALQSEAVWAGSSLNGSEFETTEEVNVVPVGIYGPTRGDVHLDAEVSLQFQRLMYCWVAGSPPTPTQTTLLANPSPSVSNRAQASPVLPPGQAVSSQFHDTASGLAVESTVSWFKSF